METVVRGRRELSLEIVISVLLFEDLYQANEGLSIQGEEAEEKGIMLPGDARVKFVLSIEVDLLESKPLQKAGDGRRGVLLCGGQDAIGQCGLLQLTFGFLADLGFKIGIGGDKQSGLAGVDAGFRAVEAGTEQLRGWKMQVNLLAIDFDITRL